MMKIETAFMFDAGCEEDHQQEPQQGAGSALDAGHSLDQGPGRLHHGHLVPGQGAV